MITSAIDQPPPAGAASGVRDEVSAQRDAALLRETGPADSIDRRGGSIPILELWADDVSASRTADNDARLVLAARGGDRRALESLVARHDARLRRLCTAILGNRTDADDAVQEAWLRVLSAIGRFAPGDVSAWLSVIARNEAYRVGGRRIPAELTAAAPCGCGDGDPYEQARGRELLGDLREALLALPRAQREVVLREAIGQSSSECAAALGLTPNALRIRRHRARRTLRAALAPAA